MMYYLSIVLAAEAINDVRVSGPLISLSDGSFAPLHIPIASASV
jgi:hypothetical protein